MPIRNSISDKLGILGLSHQATNFYIKLLGESYPFKRLNADFEVINSLLPRPSQQLKEILKLSLDKLLELNVDTILIPNITIHESIDEINFPINVVHPLPLSVHAIEKGNCHDVVLFGSMYTMSSSYIKTYFPATKNIRILQPQPIDMQLIDRVRRQVYIQNITDIMVDDFNHLVKKYSQNNAVLIACTELSIILKTDMLNVFDMAELQINAIKKL